MDAGMLIFLDTEFSSLNNWVQKRLISIALVPADGRAPFYAELAEGDGWTRDDCSSFVLDEVLPILKGGECIVPCAELRDRMLAWFSTMPRSIQLACDSEIDFRFIHEILYGHPWPENLEKRYFDLRPMVDSTVYDKAVQHYYASEHPMHNALADAQAYRLGWMAWIDANKDALSALEKSKQMHRDWVEISTAKNQPSGETK
jgi:hypothetical protein